LARKPRRRSLNSRVSRSARRVEVGERILGLRDATAQRLDPCDGLVQRAEERVATLVRLAQQASREHAQPLVSAARTRSAAARATSFSSARHRASQSCAGPVAARRSVALTSRMRPTAKTWTAGSSEWAASDARDPERLAVPALGEPKAPSAHSTRTPPRGRRRNFFVGASRPRRRPRQRGAGRQLVQRGAYDDAPWGSSRTWAIRRCSSHGAPRMRHGAVLPWPSELSGPAALPLR
jgi:hypothetical protein